MMHAEDEMKDFVKTFIEEIDRIEASFMKRYEEYKAEYQNLNSRFIKKKADQYIEEEEILKSNTKSNILIQNRSELGSDEELPRAKSSN
jgi:hypothetical protein